MQWSTITTVPIKGRRSEINQTPLNPKGFTGLLECEWQENHFYICVARELWTDGR